MTEEEIDDFNFNLVSKNSDEGYILEVDLEYPDDLHVLHNDYPLAPEKIKMNSDMPSSYYLGIANKCGIKIGEVNKLIPNLRNKENYVLDYRNLQLYLSLGMKLTKVHRVLRFKQSNRLKKLLILTRRKGKMLIINLKKLSLSLWLIVFLARQWKI